MHMLPSGNNLSALFRTLAPEESDSQAEPKSAAPGVGQEWPLFQVVTPTKPEPTPPLTPQERKRWSLQASVRVESPKPALSMSGLSSKLAQSLSQISERMVSDAAQSPEPVPTPSAPLVKPGGRVTKQAMAHVPAPKVGVSLITKPVPVMESEVLEERGNVVGLFEKPPVQPTLTPNLTPESTEVDDSLNGLFSRLAGSEKATIKPVEKRSSLSSRLGKR
jgi:hypothetical protein